MERKNLQIGLKSEFNGTTLYSPEYYDDGLSFGRVYKNYKAFYENPDEVCYVPESEFEDNPDVHEIDGRLFYEVQGYTRNDLELLSKPYDDEPYIDEDGNTIDAEAIFDGVWWQSPETYFNEIVYDI